MEEIATEPVRPNRKERRRLSAQTKRPDQAGCACCAALLQSGADDIPGVTPERSC